MYTCAICGRKVKDFGHIYTCKRCGKLICADHITNQSIALDDLELVCTSCLEGGDDSDAC